MEEIREILQQIQTDLAALTTSHNTLNEQVQELRNVAIEDQTQGRDIQPRQDRQVDPRVRRYENPNNEHDIGNFRLELPTFNGEEGPAAYIEWESEVEFIFDARQLSEIAKIRLCATSLKGFALSWWRRKTRERQHARNEFTTWRQVKEELREAFRPQSYFYDIERELHNTKQGKLTVDQYYRTILTLIEQGRVTEPETKTIARFLHGLNDDIQWGMSTQRYYSLDDALDAARESERKINKRKENRSKQIASRWTPHQTEPPSRHNPLPPAREDTNDRGKQVIEGLRPQRDRDIKCFKCDGRGHIATNCPNKRIVKITKQSEHLAASISYESADDEHTDTIQPDEEDEFLVPIDFEYDIPPISHNLVVKKVLNAIPLVDSNNTQRENIFYTRGKAKEFTCSFIIDSGSCANVANEAMVSFLQLPLLNHPNPYRLQWLSDAGELKVTKQTLIPITIGKYTDEILCDVVPMQATHILLGRPWQYDRQISFDGLHNTYTFHHQGQLHVLYPLSPKQVEDDQIRMRKAKKASRIEPVALPTPTPTPPPISLSSLFPSQKSAKEHSTKPSLLASKKDIKQAIRRGDTFHSPFVTKCVDNSDSALVLHSESYSNSRFLNDLQKGDGPIEIVVENGGDAYKVALQGFADTDSRSNPLQEGENDKDITGDPLRVLASPIARSMKNSNSSPSPNKEINEDTILNSICVNLGN